MYNLYINNKMKFTVKQKRRQGACKRAMNQEKKEVRLMREKTVLNNFTNNTECMNMYDRMLKEEFDKDKLTSVEKKVYMTCRKYIMYNDYKNLSDLQKEINSVRDMMDGEQTEEYREMYARKYKKLKNEYNEFRKELTETEEGRGLFRLCQGIEMLNKYD
jgi:hypothetical protein